ncbi:hypothetical protein [Cytobacillus praedii]|uniref:hypothetical protein n=1 Tax=Cytobacillus praedii TaxID=1742358 RepID=UPI0013F3C903|nr:hypothetical protein [Cytobacillus praedii]
MNKVIEDIENHLKLNEGKLICCECGNVEALGNISYQLRNGWKKCCGYTMEWVTK